MFFVFVLSVALFCLKITKRSREGIVCLWEASECKNLQDYSTEPTVVGKYTRYYREGMMESLSQGSKMGENGPRQNLFPCFPMDVFILWGRHWEWTRMSVLLEVCPSPFPTLPLRNVASWEEMRNHVVWGVVQNCWRSCGISVRWDGDCDIYWHEVNGSPWKFDHCIIY